MTTTAKTPEQVEFYEIAMRLKKRGLNQSDMARELHVTRAAVAMILMGDRNPRPATLVMLQDLENRLKATGTSKGKATPLQKLVNRLAYLEKNDRPNFQVAQRLIESLAPPTNSTVAAGQKRLLKKAFAAPRSGAPK